MFNLENAIQNWKRQLRANPAFEDGDIAELESHLREEVERLKADGLTEEEAFQQASGKIGEPEIIGGELYKTRTTNIDATPPWQQKTWIPSLLPNHLKVAIRNVKNNRLTTLLNVGGLAIGLACFILIAMYVWDELGYDRFHRHADRIYRINDIRMTDGVGESMASTVTPAAEALLNDYPGQIEEAVRLFNFATPSLAVSYHTESGEIKKFNESGFYFADPGFFDLFDFPLAEGNPETALSAPYTVVLTREMARKYFGNENPIGKTLRFEDKRDLTVTGVLENIPYNSHIQVDFLASFQTLDDPEIMAPRLRNTWVWNPTWTYILLDENTDPENLEAQLPAFVQKYFPESRRDHVTLKLQPLTKIHLYSNLSNELQPPSDISYVYTFSAIAVIILLIACTNFINLATAHSSSRAKEVGLRKTLGAEKKMLVSQFLGESMLMGMMAALVSIPLVKASLPLLNSIAGKEMTLGLTESLPMLGGLVLFGIVIGGVAGIYPSFVLSSFTPSRILRGRLLFDGFDSSIWLRKILVTGQFSLLILLLVGAFIVHQQLDYLRSSKLGFNQEEVVLVPVFRSQLSGKYGTFKDRVQQFTGIESLTIIEDIPGKYFNTGSYTPEGFDGPRQFQRLMALPGVTETLGLELVAGRRFDPNRAENKFEAIVNRSMVTYLGWGTPEETVGKILDTNFGDQDLEIIGVVEDFHFTSLHQPIKPFALNKMPESNQRAMSFFGRYLALRINGEQVESTLNHIEQTWNELITDRPFDYFFLDQELDATYRSEEKLSKVVTAFTFLAIFVACLGLFGLVHYITERRTKEIGIRKVLGASVQRIVFLVSKEFLTVVAVSTLVAWPLGYLVIREWLNSFASRIDVTIWPFISASLIALVAAWVTVSYKSIKAARSNPVESLQAE